MAKEGRKLTSFYAAPVCSPSRASLMTGSYPKRALPIPHVLFPEGPTGLSPDELTDAEVLKHSGYATAIAYVLFLGILALTVVQLVIGRRFVHYRS